MTSHSASKQKVESKLRSPNDTSSVGCYESDNSCSSSHSSTRATNSAFLPDTGNALLLQKSLSNITVSFPKVPSAWRLLISASSVEVSWTGSDKPKENSTTRYSLPNASSQLISISSRWLCWQQDYPEGVSSTLLLEIQHAEQWFSKSRQYFKQQTL